MLATLLALAVLMFGWVLTWQIPLSLYRFERVALSISLGTLFGSWLLLGLVALFGGVSGIWWAVTGLIVATALLWPLRQGKQQTLPSPLRRVWQVVSVVTLVGFGYLFLTHFLMRGLQGWYSAGNTWGDIALHLSLASYFAYQPHLQLQFPLLPHTPLTYPFLLDFASAMLFKGGWSWQASLALPGLALTLSFVQLMLGIVYRLTNSARAAWLTLLLFLCSGSPAGLFYLMHDWEAGQLPSLLTPLSGPIPDYTMLSQHGLQMANVVTDILLPQRGMLLGLAIFAAVLLCLLQALKDSAKSRALFIWAGALVGFLPFAHVHSALVGFLLLVVGALTVRSYRSPEMLNWLLSLVIALALALPQLIWQFRGGYSSGFAYFHVGWMRESGSLLAFWLANVGVLPLLALAGWRQIRGQGKHLATMLALLGLILFVAVNLAIFQPNNWDNIKLLSYAYLAASLLAAIALDHWLVGRIRLLAVGLVVLSTLIGGITILREMQRHDLFLSNSEVAFATHFRQIVPPGSRILTSSRHNSPIPTLTGRPIILGYPGWLSSYGFPYQPVERDVETMLAGEDGAIQLISQYQVAYVALDPDTTIYSNQAFFAAHYRLILEYAGWQVYQTTLPTPVQ